MQSDTLRLRLIEAFKRGKQLFADEDFDFAHELFSQCAMHDPNNIPVVEAMLGNLRAKFGENKKNVSRSLSLGGNRALKKAMAAKNWLEALRSGIERLKTNPWHVSTLRALAEVCEARHHNEVELVYLKQALDAAPKSVEVNRHCAISLGRMGQFDQAIACWHRVETIEGKSDEVSRMISQLAAEKLKYPNGRPPSASQHSKEISTASESQELEPQSTAAVPSNPRQFLERAIANDPYDVANYLDLADLLCDQKQFKQAEELLKRGIGVAGKHTALVNRLQRVRDQRIEHEEAIERARRSNGLEDRFAPRRRMPWLELSLVGAGAALTLLVFPSIGSAIWYGLDFRNWNATAWMVANVALVVVLCALRFGPEWLAARKNK